MNRRERRRLARPVYETPSGQKITPFQMRIRERDAKRYKEDRDAATARLDAQDAAAIRQRAESVLQDLKTLRKKVRDDEGYGG